MWESVLSNLLAPVIIAGATAFFGFKWGRKKTSDELERSHTENATLIVNLVNKQLDIVMRGFCSREICRNLKGYSRGKRSSFGR